MKTKIASFALLIVVIGVLYSMKNNSKLPEGPHGGRIKEADNYYIEVKSVYSHFYVYLLNKEYKTVIEKNTTCEIRFFLYDGSTLDIPLKPYAEGGFTMDYYSMDYNSYRIMFNVAGKSVSAKFENENALVQNK